MKKNFAFLLTLALMMAVVLPANGETYNFRKSLAIEFAECMGIISTDHLTWISVAGIPTEINGQKVPESLYTEEQLRAIHQARNIDRLMGEVMMQETHVLQYQRNVPIESTEVDTSVY